GDSDRRRTPRQEPRRGGQGRQQEAARPGPGPPDTRSPLCAAVPSHDEDPVQRELHAQRARQELVPHGGAGRLAGGQKLHRLPLPQRPLRRPVHAHHRGLPPEGLQHPGRHVPAGHPGHLRQPPLPCHAQAVDPHSLDNRESFDEVKRLQKQILEVKSCLKNKTKEAGELPMVICGNKNDHGELCRQVPATEAELLVSGDENCAYFEVSAKKNTNVDEMFYVLFSMAKLPHEMSPALHRKISVQYGDAFHPRPFCMRRVKDVDAYGMVSPFARRPSVNSDLKYIKAKVLREGQARERDKCTIQ
uniref:RASD family member 2 n=1 Tax=Felis catus TaxID=9685 RepID=A0ABI7XR56_FELCA